MSGLEGFDGRFMGIRMMLVSALVSLLGVTSYELVTRHLRPKPGFAVLTATAATYILLEVGVGQPQSFIYFQF